MYFLQEHHSTPLDTSNISRSDLHYQAFLAQYREQLIDTLASRHIDAKLRSGEPIADGNKIHVSIFIAHYLSRYAFTPLRRVPKGPVVNPALCRITTDDLDNFIKFICDEYRPSKIIPALAQDLTSKFKSFFQENLPFDLHIAANADKLFLFLEQLGLPSPLFYRLSHDALSLIHSAPSHEMLESYILEEFLKTRLAPVELNINRPSAAQPLPQYSLIIVKDHFCDEIYREPHKLVNNATFPILKLETRDKFGIKNNHYQTYSGARLKAQKGTPLETHERIRLDKASFQSLYLAGKRNFENVVFTEPLDFIGLPDDSLNFNDRKYLFTSCTFTGASFAHPPITDGVHLDTSEILKLSLEGCEEFGNIVFDGYEGRFTKTLEFYTIYDLGIRRFCSIWIDKPLDTDRFNLDECSFEKAHLHFTAGTRLNNNQFVRLVQASVRNFEEIEFIDAIDLPTLVSAEQNHCHFTSARFATPPFIRATARSVYIPYKLVNTLYESGVRDFTGIDLSSIDMRKISSESEKTCSLQIQGASIGFGLYCLLSSFGIDYNFNQAVLRSENLLKPSIITPKILKESKNLNQFAAITYFTLRGDFRGLDLSQYKFKDCEFDFSFTADGFYQHLSSRSDFSKTLISLLRDYTNSWFNFGRRRHIQVITNLLKDESFMRCQRPDELLQRLREALIYSSPINPEGELMKRIRFAIELYSFDGKTVDEVLLKHGFPVLTPPSAAADSALAFALAMTRAGAGASPPSAAAGAGTGLVYS